MKCGILCKVNGLRFISCARYSRGKELNDGFDPHYVTCRTGIDYGKGIGNFRVQEFIYGIMRTFPLVSVV